MAEVGETLSFLFSQELSTPCHSTFSYFFFALARFGHLG